MYTKMTFSSYQVAVLNKPFTVVQPVHTSFFKVNSRIIQSRFFSRTVRSVLISSWIFTSESHGEIYTSNNLHRFPFRTLSVL